MTALDELNAICDDSAINHALGNDAFNALCKRIALAEDAVERLASAVRAWDATLSDYCDGDERNEVRAALAAVMK